MSKWISRRPSLFFFFQRTNESVWKSCQQQCCARTRHNERTNWNCTQNIARDAEEKRKLTVPWNSQTSKACFLHGLSLPWSYGVPSNPQLSSSDTPTPFSQILCLKGDQRWQTSPKHSRSTKSLLPSWETTVYSVFDCWRKVRRNTAVEFNVMVLCAYICTCCLHILTKIHHIFVLFVFVWAQVVMCYNMYVGIREQLRVWIFSYQFETGSVRCLLLHEMGYWPTCFWGLPHLRLSSHCRSTEITGVNYSIWLSKAFWGLKIRSAPFHSKGLPAESSSQPVFMGQWLKVVWFLFSKNVITQYILTILFPSPNISQIFPTSLSIKLYSLPSPSLKKCKNNKKINKRLKKGETNKTENTKIKQKAHFESVLWLTTMKHRVCPGVWYTQWYSMRNKT